MLRLAADNGFIEIDVVEFGGEGTPAEEDAYITIRVQSSGFVGSNDLWVDGADFKSFCLQLVELERARKGEARLSSISPDELNLTIKAIDSLGHVAVIGTTGYAVQGGQQMYEHGVTFGFEFDPSQLAAAVVTPLVKSRVESE